MPHTICSRVLLPHPLGPTRPSVSPFSSSNPISRSAQKSVCRARARGNSSRNRSAGRRYNRYSLETF
jgi:hypothetical protein